MALTLTDSITKEQVLKNIAGMQQPATPTNTPAPRAPIGGAVLSDGTITQNGSTPIPVSTLEGSKTFNVPQVKSTEAQTNLGMKVAVGTPTPTVETKPQSEVDKMRSLLAEQGTESAFRAQEQQSAGLEQARLANQALEKEQADTTLKYNAEIEKLRQNRGGMIGEAFDARVSQLESKKNQELANIAIRKSVAQGDVNTALALVKDKVDAKFEPIKNQIETLKAQFSMVQNDMSESEKMKAQAEITKQTQAYQLQKDREQFSQQLKLQALKDGIVISSDDPAVIAREYSAKTGNQVSTGSMANYSVVDQLFNSDTDAITGIPSLKKFIPGTEAQLTKNLFEQVKGILSLENRSKLKGQGAVSDFEGKTLDRAASALGTNLSDADFRKQLSQIRGAFATAAGLPATVVVKDPYTGETKEGDMTRNAINAAVAQGYQISYK